MQLTYTETQTLLESSALHWLGAHADAMRDGTDADGGWAGFAEMGWLALPFAEADGGFGGGPVEVGLLMRAFGRFRIGAPAYRSGVLMAARVIAELGDTAQRATWLDALMSGERRAAMAHAEVGADDPWALPTATARMEGGQWTISARKSLVAGARDADVLVVSARLAGDASRIGLFIVPANAAGVIVHPCRMADGSAAADIVLDAVTLPPDAWIGAKIPATSVRETLAMITAEAMIATCWEAVGAMRAALDATLAYVTQREQFGRALSAFQVVQHRLAEMAVCCEEATAACELAALRVVADRRLACDAASMARSCTARAARYVAANAVQLLGGMGVSEELQVAGLFRLLTRFQLQDGHADWHAARRGGALSENGWRQSQTLLEPASAAQTAGAHAKLETYA